MNDGRSTICLCMIVKDEAEVITRCLDSCRELIDSWVICDTGSTDGTQEIIRGALTGIPGELHEREWRNFGHNRSELMALAHGHADYLLLLDADMTLDQQVPVGVLTAGSYMLRQTQGDGQTSWYNKRLVRGDLHWRFRGSTHEYIECLDGPESVERLETISVEHHADGDSWAHKFERDLELLSTELAENPNDARTRFYLAQTCSDLGLQTGNEHMLENALDHYQRRAEMPGWVEETYHAQHQVGVLSERLGDWPRAIDAYIRAWEIRPVRLEAIHRLTAGLRERGHNHAAHRFARMAANLRPLPVPDDLLFVTRWVYEWGMLFEYSITSYWVGEYRNSMSACQSLLRIASLPETHRNLTAENLRHATREDAHVRAEAQASRRQRRIKHVGTPTRGRASDAPPREVEEARRTLIEELERLTGMTPAAIDEHLFTPGRPVTVTVPSLGLDIRLRPGTDDAQALVDACDDPAVLAQTGLTDARLIVVAGAEAGIGALCLAHLYPAARMIAIERDPDAFEVCRANLEGRAEVVEAALGALDDESGDLAPMLRLDTLLDRLASGEIVDFLRLDCGSELLDVLRAGDGWAARVASISVGIAPEDSPAEVFGELRRLGFETGAAGEGRIAGTRQTERPAPA